MSNKLTETEKIHHLFEIEERVSAGVRSIPNESGYVHL